MNCEVITELSANVLHVDSPRAEHAKAEDIVFRPRLKAFKLADYCDLAKRCGASYVVYPRLRAVTLSRQRSVQPVGSIQFCEFCGVSCFIHVNMSEANVDQVTARDMNRTYTCWKGRALAASVQLPVGFATSTACFASLVAMTSMERPITDILAGQGHQVLHLTEAASIINHKNEVVDFNTTDTVTKVTLRTRLVL